MVQHLLNRNLVLQNESLDDDLEHFKDIKEEEEDDDGDYQTNETEIKTAQAVHDMKNCDGNGTDSESSASQDDSTPPDSEGYDSDEANDFFMGDGQDENIKESKPIADDNKLLSKVEEGGSTFPGGYNLQHREPLYWYLYHSLFLVGMRKHMHRHLLYVCNWQLCSVIFPDSWVKE